jgi:hypothetical protein
MARPPARGRADAADDRGGAEQDEAAQDDGRAVAPVHPAGQHHEADGGHGHHRHGGGDIAQQRALQPHHARQQSAGALRIGLDGLGVGLARGGGQGGDQGGSLA